MTKAGQLEGRVHKRNTLWWLTNDATTDLAKLEWVIEAPQGNEVGVVARHERARTVRERSAGKQPPVVENELLLQQPRNERRT